MTDHRVVAAYRDYAHERRETIVLIGELTLVGAGAAFGASLPAVLEGGWRTWPAASFIVVAAFGILAKRNGEQRWTAQAQRYERRRVELLAPPAEQPGRVNAVAALLRQAAWAFAAGSAGRGAAARTSKANHSHRR